ncbi:hypothetical protein QVG61_03050 [Thiohalobacter sp. IOR34]|uniref:hypothetical protein n=1 Tax=Thiohalobacter sp. IOR34 TaxID=3057176 RepID=UPI0025B0043A|nr:hypothetical protein [Thiohalobacter sp. IOR34]WJW76085.1 hypothetical protein QVG61_03050 [Thiohalobacter sp. IOR34]
MSKPFQRIGSRSNAHVGNDFELTALEFFKSEGLTLERNVKVQVGIEGIKKEHAFDLGSIEQKIIVECKSHKWTSGANVPSAKLTVWNEAMYYFVAAPKGFRKIMFVLYDFSEKRKETLAQYYLRTYKHLVPCDVEFWEYNETNLRAEKLCI